MAFVSDDRRQLRATFEAAAQLYQEAPPGRLVVLRGTGTRTHRTPLSVWTCPTRIDDVRRRYAPKGSRRPRLYRQVSDLERELINARVWVGSHRRACFGLRTHVVETGSDTNVMEPVREQRRAGSRASNRRARHPA